LQSGDRGAVAEALNLADDRRPAQREAALALLETLEREAPFPGAARIGITGAPGAGKSTLLDSLVRNLRPRGDTLAIIAVDPSSQRTGGALLGDRARVGAGASDPGVFIRSMAARERLGGLAETARAGVTILAAAFDRVFVETVGVGQSEVEVATLVDTLVYVASPGAGDTLQFMKAGILEEPDIFVVNKADFGAMAERTAGDLQAGLGLGEREREGWEPPILLASARDATGIDELVAAIEAHTAYLNESGEIRERRRSGRAAWLLETLASRYGSYGLERIGGAASVAARLDEASSGYATLAALGSEIEEALSKPR
jgi:LAO/AO transport system kinase